MKTVTFSDVVTRCNTKEDRHNTDKLYYVGGEHISSNEMKVAERGVIEGSIIGPMFYCGFKPGDILFVTRNPHLRKCAVVDFEGICSEKTFVLETKDSSILLQEYLAMVMHSDDFWDYCDANKSGGVNYFVNWSTLAEYEFDLPPLPEQKRLAEKLWAAYEVKQSYLNMLSATDEMLKAQFLEMFGKSLKVSINDMVDTIWGSSPDSETYNDNGNGLPFYQGKTEFGDVYINDATVFCSKPIKVAYQNDILMSVRAPVGSVNIAKEKCCIGRGLASIVPKEGIAERLFVFHALRILEDEISRLGTGSTFKAINKDGYKKIILPLASIGKQKQFVSTAEQADRLKSELRKSIESIDKVIKSLTNEKL